jgi:hypothetical protein
MFKIRVYDYYNLNQVKSMKREPFSCHGQKTDCPARMQLLSIPVWVLVWKGSSQETEVTLVLSESVSRSEVSDVDLKTSRISLGHFKYFHFSEIQFIFFHLHTYNIVRYCWVASWDYFLTTCINITSRWHPYMFTVRGYKPNSSADFITLTITDDLLVLNMHLTDIL